MILVSFSSAEDALSNNVNKYNTFSSQGTENPPFRFLGDTRYNGSLVCVMHDKPVITSRVQQRFSKQVNKSKDHSYKKVNNW